MRLSILNSEEEADWRVWTVAALKNGLCDCFSLSLPLRGVAVAPKTFDPYYISGLVYVARVFLQLAGLGVWGFLIWPKHNCTFSAALLMTARLSQLSFITCGGIVVTSLWVVTTIANRLMRLQMTRWNDLIWKLLCMVREARWKQRRQRIIYEPPENWDRRTNGCFECMDWAQCVKLRGMWFSESLVRRPKRYIRSGEEVAREDQSRWFNFISK